MRPLTRVSAAAALAAAAIAAAPALAPAAGHHTFPTCDPAAKSIVFKQGGTIDRTDGVITQKGGYFTSLKKPITIKMTKTVWVYQTRADFGSRTYACYKPTRRARLLWISTGGADITDIFARQIAVAGNAVAVHIEAGGDSDNYDRFRSIDVRTGKVLRDSGKLVRAAGNPSLPSAVAVTTSGDMVALAGTRLAAIDSDPRTLASIDAGPITGVGVSGDTAHWTQAGATHSARLG